MIVYMVFDMTNSENLSMNGVFVCHKCAAFDIGFLSRIDLSENTR